ncbi:hypothetical protein chiPu_0022907 [Chiloscyllium punctatum]|uniref:Uncharacterized protein n=1 Tax=Chiloscyllium punctatum TaxID=137246 RepID=A0A401T8N5_CHIPU|nr:hypothetical protein [Chiloscyllium punctatum]
MRSHSACLNLFPSSFKSFTDRSRENPKLLRPSRKGSCGPKGTLSVSSRQREKEWAEDDLGEESAAFRSQVAVQKEEVSWVFKKKVF